MEERRRELRSRTLKAGRLVFSNGNSTLDCVVRNLPPDIRGVAAEEFALFTPLFLTLIVGLVGGRNILGNGLAGARRDLYPVDGELPDRVGHVSLHLRKGENRGVQG
jgi:hypothetical protein